ncbi:ATP-binding protein [Pedobacter sp. PLR]|uniref:AlbA family DNA-binding domain-containing protein n=1 Tax=Pedobacter sp. PLR TaxID=2994465 RepID=UPI00224755CF|nr:ATP-binding protein [Pedobacter sp. PLR]MCX2453671.1 ATP-binding protein [Pedobacter sp. PLR]
MNIRKLIQQGEGTTLDFKRTINNYEKIARSIVAFANHKGGQLLIGVADDGTIKGVKSEDEERYMLLRSAQEFCRPSIDLSFEEVHIEDKIVLVVNIKPSETKPHYALDENKKWWVYFRIQDKSLLASKILVDVIKKSTEIQVPQIPPGKEEKLLFDYLTQEGRITLKQYSKLLKTSFKKAQKILVAQILCGAIQPHSSEMEEYFTTIPQQLQDK